MIEGEGEARGARSTRKPQLDQELVQGHLQLESLGKIQGLNKGSPWYDKLAKGVAWLELGEEGRGYPD